MIQYILISYFIMFFWCLKWALFDGESVKRCIKAFVFAPIVFPAIIFVRFINW